MTDVEALPAGLPEALCEPSAYPFDASAAAGVEWVQTHISHVFLTGERVYKLRKAVDLGFLSFASARQRTEDCRSEVALNRRLAPDVYLGVATVRRVASGARVGATREPDAVGGAPGEETCVVMRRLPSGRDALSLLESGALVPGHLDRIAARMARFHDEVRANPDGLSPEAWRERCVGPVAENFRVLAEAAPNVVDAAALRRAQERSQDFASRSTDVFERRRRDGRRVDGHGDLHLQHVWFEQDEHDPIIVDCLEFNESLRSIDAASEVGFLAMDLVYRQRADLAERFLGVYAAESDDFDLYSVVDFFVSYRAAVRAKVASLAARDAGIDREQRRGAAASAARHLDLAIESLASRRPAPVILVGGTVGSGKSTVARELAYALRGPVISSDRVRKRLAGLTLLERTRDGIERGIYAPGHTERVYRTLAERAEVVIASGRPAVLDATWARSAHRRAARDAAAAAGADTFFLEVRCDRALALRRLVDRAAAGADPSDAGPELLERSIARFEPPAEFDEGHRAVLATDDPDWPASIPALAERLRRTIVKAGRRP